MAEAAGDPLVSIVVPTLGRPSLSTLLAALTPAPAPAVASRAIDHPDGTPTAATRAGSGQAASRQAGSGQAGSGQTGSRRAGSGQTGSRQADFGHAGSRQADFGHAGFGQGAAGAAGAPGAAGSAPPGEWELILVDDRRPAVSDALPVPPDLRARTRVLAGRGAGPAAARNIGWRAARAGWVVFLDDDVRPEPDWWDRLADDLDVPAGVGGVQGRLVVPLPGHRRPTDWERVTHGLTDGWWITADMAYRRAALAAAGGFDERFPRAFREDAELAHRVTRAGWSLVRGERRTVHPVRPEGPWISLRVQRGNADDALLRRLYGAHWRELLAVPRGRRRAHTATTAAGCLALLAVAARCRPGGRGRLGRVWGPVALVAAAGWLGGTADFAGARIRPGPRHAAEVGAMLVTSALIPPLATAYWLRGWWRSRGAQPIATRAAAGSTAGPQALPNTRPALDSPLRLVAQSGNR